MHIFSRFPRLSDIHYEPWREWSDTMQPFTDRSHQLLFESLASYNIRRLVIFENFNQHYPSNWDYCAPIRIPNPNTSRAIASISLRLEELSASFTVDASHFLDACQASWEWPNLTSIVLTSQSLTPRENPAQINDVLAMLFSYQSGSGRGGNPVVVTCRGTWELVLQSTVTRAWEAVAAKHRYIGPVLVKELLTGAGATAIKSHGDAIHLLKLSGTVIRPVSLQQIQMEHQVLKGV